MKALHLVKTTDGATWALRQVEVLCDLGVETVVALPSATAGLASRYAAVGAQVVAADLDFTPTEPWRLGAALRRCRALVARVRPDLIHSHFVSTTLVARLALGRHHPIPRVFQVPGILHLEHAVFRALDLATAGPADHWVGSCRWTWDAYLRLGVPPERVSLSYYGTDLAPFARPRGGALRREFGVGSDEQLVGMVAWMYRPKWFLGQRRGIKGHEDFIAALRLAQVEDRRVRGVVVGGAWAGAVRYERRLQRQAAAAGGPGICFTGARQDVPAIYADLDVAVHPSLSENCGGAVESLAVGCPTVATAVGGLPDVVRDGDTGWLVPPRDPAALAAAVRDALAHPAEARRRSLRGRELVRELFDVQRTGDEIARLYRRLVGGTDERAVSMRHCAAER